MEGRLPPADSEKFTSELLLYNYHTQGTKLVIPYDFVTNPRNSHERSE